jgi:uncharacterized repeat protein (TIGR02543 family)
MMALIGVLAITASGLMFGGASATAVSADITPSVTVSSAGGFNYGALSANPINIQFTTQNALASNKKIMWVLTLPSNSSSVLPTCGMTTQSCPGFTVSKTVGGVTSSLAPGSLGLSLASTTNKLTVSFYSAAAIEANSLISLNIAANILWLDTNSGVSRIATDAGAAEPLDDTTSLTLGVLVLFANPPKTVTFSSNFGTPSTLTQQHVGSANLTSNGFSRPGYTFRGWNTAADGTSGTAYADMAVYPFSTNETIYAVWSPTSHTVTYNVHGGSSVSAGSFLTDGSVTLGAAPSLAGYGFAGWYTAASGGTRAGSAGASYSPGGTSAVELHAQWTALSRTVTFNANGGTGTMTAQTSGSAAVLTTNTIARTGYGFTGWNTAANGSGTAYAVDATYPFTSSETLYAQWRALPAAPVAAVDIQVPVGSAIANAPVALDIDGLKDQTGYVVTVFSTPQIVDQGTIWSGRLNTTVRIPSNLEAGWHRLVIEGTAADGTPWTEENYFKVSPGGILLATSEVIPAELAMTGSNSVPVFYGAGALIILGFVFLLTNTTLRRRVKQKD